jgi:hypothetical protein
MTYRALLSLLLLATSCTIHHHHYMGAPSVAAVSRSESVPAAPDVPVQSTMHDGSQRRVAEENTTAHAAPSPPIADAPPGTAADAASPRPPSPPARSFVEAGRHDVRLTMEDLAAADAELARRFSVPKAFLIAHRATLSIYTQMLARVGRPGELAPILEVPGGGYVIGAHRRFAPLVTHPEIIRLDATGAVLWTLALPRSRSFLTYEVNGALFAPDGAIVVKVVPFNHQHAPRPSMLAKVTLDGQLVWSMQVSENPALFDGPFPQDLTIDGDGTIQLTGWGTPTDRREREDESSRVWTGSVSASGRMLSNRVGGPFVFNIYTSPTGYRLFWFWHDLHWPRA